MSECRIVGLFVEKDRQTVKAAEILLLFVYDRQNQFGSNCWKEGGSEVILFAIFLFVHWPEFPDLNAPSIIPEKQLITILPVSHSLF